MGQESDPGLQLYIMCIIGALESAPRGVGNERGCPVSRKLANLTHGLAAASTRAREPAANRMPAGPGSSLQLPGHPGPP